MIELKKEKDSWCSHCDPAKGCTIYETRPQECRNFQCLWLGAPEPWHTLLANLKPNKVKFVLGWHDENQVLQIHPDPSYPEHWKKYSEFFLTIGEQLAIAVFTQEGVLAVGNKAKERWQDSAKKELTN